MTYIKIKNNNLYYLCTFLPNVLPSKKTLVNCSSVCEAEPRPDPVVFTQSLTPQDQIIQKSTTRVSRKKKKNAQTGESVMKHYDKLTEVCGKPCTQAAI